MKRWRTHTKAHSGARRCLSHYAPKTMGDSQGRHDESGRDSPNSDDSQKRKRGWERGKGAEGGSNSPKKDRVSLDQTGGYETTDYWTNDPKQPLPPRDATRQPQNQDDDQDGTKNRRTIRERNKKMNEDFLSREGEQKKDWQPTQEEADAHGERMDEALTNARATQQCADDIDQRMSELGDSFATRRKEIKERLEREMEDLSRQEDSQMEEIAKIRHDVFERGGECIQQLQGFARAKGTEPNMTRVYVRPLPSRMSYRPITPRTIQHGRGNLSSPCKDSPKTSRNMNQSPVLRINTTPQTVNPQKRQDTATMNFGFSPVTTPKRTMSGAEGGTSGNCPPPDSDDNKTPTRVRLPNAWLSETWRPRKGNGTNQPTRTSPTLKRPTMTPQQTMDTTAGRQTRTALRSGVNTPQSPSNQSERVGTSTAITPEAFMTRLLRVEDGQNQLTQVMMLLTSLNQRQQQEKDEPYKKKKKDCPAPEKFQGAEGEAIDTWLELFHEWTETQNLTPKAEVAALLKNLGKIPARVLNNLPAEERWDPKANYGALRERWSHENAREVNRQDFNQRKQKDGESLEEFMDELCRIRRSGWKTEQKESFEEAVKNTFWVGIRNELVMEQMWNILQLHELQDISLKEILANAKRAKYVIEQKALRGKTHPRQPQAPFVQANYEQRQEREPPVFRSNAGKCYGCGGAHRVADCRDPYLLKNRSNVKAILESGTSEQELWELAQRSAEADYRAESIARCFDDGGVYALERKPGSCFRCGEIGHKANECQNGPRGSNNVMCGSCGAQGHTSQTCMRRAVNNPKVGVTCYSCGEVGHYSNECKSERVGRPAMMGDKPNYLRPQQQRTPEPSLANIEARLTMNEQKTDKIFSCLESLCKMTSEGRTLGGTSSAQIGEPLAILQRESGQQTCGSNGAADTQKN